jgi:hypothetical protein
MAAVAGPRLRGLQKNGLVAVVVGLVLVLASFVYHPVESFTQGLLHAYLGAYLFWFGVTAGSLGLLMLHHTVGGGWGFVIRRPLEAGSKLIWLAALMFIPVGVGVFFGMYPWTDPKVQAEPSVHIKLPLLNPASFWGVSIFLFFTWWLYSRALNGWGRDQNRPLSEQERIDNSARLTVVGASGIVWYVLSMTAMTVLWIMSLTPTWISSMFGFMMVPAHGLTTLAFMVWLFPRVFGDRPLTEAIPSKYYRDLGNLMFAFTMLWAYMSFSQYLITFSGNTTEEVVWYVPRSHGPWMWVSLVVIVGGFVIPFLWLIIGALGPLRWKDRAPSLATVAFYILLMRVVDFWWWVAPTFRPDHFSVNPADVGFVLLLGGIWVYCWAAELLKAPSLAPEHDPRLRNYLYEVADHA